MVEKMVGSVPFSIAFVLRPKYIGLPNFNEIFQPVVARQRLKVDRRTKKLIRDSDIPNDSESIGIKNDGSISSSSERYIHRHKLNIHLCHMCCRT